MNNAVPWSVKGLGFDAREAAKEAARRSGMTLGEWLNSVITDRAAERGLTPDDIDSDERVEAVAARLIRLIGREGTAAHRPHPRTRHGRERDPRRPRERARSREAGSETADTSDDAASLPRPLDDPEAMLDQATEHAGRNGDAGRAAIDALQSVAKRLAEIDGRISERGDEASYGPIKMALAKLEQKLAQGEPSVATAQGGEKSKDLDRLEAKLSALLDSLNSSRAGSGAQRFALLERSEGAQMGTVAADGAKPVVPRPISEVVAEIARRQRDLDTPGWHDAEPRQAVHVESAERAFAAAYPTASDRHDRRIIDRRADDRSFKDLDQKLETITASIETAANLARSTAAPEATAGRDLHGEIERLARGLEELRQPHPEIAALRQEVADMSRAIVDLAPRGSIATLEVAIHDLAQRIETSRDGSLRDSLIAPIEALAADLRAMLHSADPRASIEGLDREIRTIGRKIEAMNVQAFDPLAFAQIQQHIREVRDLLIDAAARPAHVDKIERQIAALGDRIERLAIDGASRVGVADVAASISDVRQLLSQSAPAASLHSLERRIEMLAGKIDDAMAAPAQPVGLEELTKRIDQIHLSLTRRLDAPRAAEPVDTSSLEDVVRSLAATMEAARQPLVDARAIEGLEVQISRIADRIERSDASLASLSSLERSIPDLFAQLDGTRHAAVDAAETAARTAARDTLREVMRSVPAGTDGAVGDVPQKSELISHELAEIRRLQDHADRRVHSTLTTVHETLEKVVDRLATLEDDLAEVRPAAVHAAPIFAPLPQRPLERPQQPLADVHSAAPSLDIAAKAPIVIPKIAGELQRPPRETGRKAFEDSPAAAAPATATADSLQTEDFLIEPGSGFLPSRNGAGSSPTTMARQGPAGPPVAAGLGREGGGQASFIAAARRAAQAAAADSAVAAAARRPATMIVEPMTSGGNRAAAAKSFIASRKRPLLLGLGGIVIAMTALVAYQTLNRDGRDTAIEAAPASTKALSAKPEAPLTEVPKTDVPKGEMAKPDGGLARDMLPAPSKPLPSSGKPSTSLAPAGINAREQVVGQAGLSPFSPSPMASGGNPLDEASASSIVPPAAAVDPDRVDPGAAGAAGGLSEVAQAGNAAAQYELGARFAEGRQVARDFKAAASWFEKAATQGLAPAQYRLGSLYEKGLGVSRDGAIAKMWYQRAGERGNARAMHNLAVLSAEGAGGKPDYAMAATWFRKAAEFGVRDSQYNLAILYARGLGIEQSLTQSYMWFSVAAAQGDEDAGKKRDDVASRMDAKALAAAKALVAGFQPKPPDQAANEVNAPAGGWDAGQKPDAKAPAKLPSRPKVSGL